MPKHPLEKSPCTEAASSRATAFPPFRQRKRLLRYSVVGWPSDLASSVLMAPEGQRSQELPQEGLRRFRVVSTRPFQSGRSCANRRSWTGFVYKASPFTIPLRGQNQPLATSRMVFRSVVTSYRCWFDAVQSMPASVTATPSSGSKADSRNPRRNTRGNPSPCSWQ